MMSARDIEEARICAAYARRPKDARYSLFRQGQLFLVQERERETLAMLQRHGFESLHTARIVEIGCGTGLWLRDFVRWGARPENITGLDLLPDRVAEARRVCPPSVTIACGHAADLGLASNAYDLVVQSTVFTSILAAEMKRQVAAEMIRIVKTEGLILWYDFHINHPGNPDTRAVKKAEIRQLFPGCRIELRRITLAPPLLRFLAPYSWVLCQVLGKMPWLCTHYLGAIRRQ
jgi:ubiquinone/menaquinone biosynthesis C-methylase UbiE